jgi:hypothetical protein
MEFRRAWSFSKTRNITLHGRLETYPVDGVVVVVVVLGDLFK